MADVIARTESQYDACAVHVRGPREFGLGMIGLMVDLHRNKWDQTAPISVFYLPEHSAAVIARFMRRSNSRKWRGPNAKLAKTWLGFLQWYRGYENLAGDERFCARLLAFKEKLETHLTRLMAEIQETFPAGLQVLTPKQ